MAFSPVSRLVYVPVTETYMAYAAAAVAIVSSVAQNQAAKKSAKKSSAKKSSKKGAKKGGDVSRHSSSRKA